MQLESTAEQATTSSYQYAISGVNSYNVQGDIAEIVTAVTVASGEIVVSGIPVFETSAGVNDKYLYRTTAGLADVFWKRLQKNVQVNPRHIDAVWRDTPKPEGVMALALHIIENHD